MGGYSNQNNGGTDFSKYQPISVNGLLVGNTAYQTLYSATGKGFIDLAVVCNTTASSGAEIKITVDGVLKVDVNNGSNVPTGFLTSNNITGMDANLVGVRCRINVREIQNFLPYPNNVGAVGSIIGGNPIFFNSSILIEIKATINTAQNLTYSISGGIQ